MSGGNGTAGRGWWSLGAALGLVGLAAAVFGCTAGHGFLSWDDRANFLENPHLSTQSLRGLGAFWRGTYGELYIPVTYTVWGILARLSGMAGAGSPFGAGGSGGLSPVLFHGVNVILHAGSAVLVFMILRRVLIGAGRGGVICWPAWVGAAVFAVHPVQVEAVAWATGMKDVLAGFLGLAAMALYSGSFKFSVSSLTEGERQDAIDAGRVRANESERGRMCGSGRGAVGEKGAMAEIDGGADPPARRFAVSDRARYGVATGMFVLALLAKPGAAAVPVMVLALETAALGAGWKRSATRLWPWFAAALAAALVTRGAQGEAVALQAEAGANPVWLRPFVFLDALGFYLGKVMVPAGLGVDYGRTPEWLLESGQWRVTWVVGTAVSAAAVLGWRWSGRGNPVWRLLVAAWAVFVAGVLPVSGLAAFAFQAHSTVADRYLYLPMLGAALAAAWGFSILDSRYSILKKGGREGERGEDIEKPGYEKEDSKREEGAGVAEKGNQGSGIGNRNWALAVAGVMLVTVLGILSWRQAGHWRDSGSLVARALEVNPESPEMNYARANQYYDTGDVETSIAYYRKALEGNGRHWRAHHLLANALGEKGSWDRALEHLRKAEAIVPKHPAVLGDLGYALAATGNRRAAEEKYRRALAVAPEDVRSRHDLGVLLLERGAFGEAVTELRRAWKKAPDEATAWNLEMALERYAGQLEGEGRAEEARAVKEEARELRGR